MAAGPARAARAAASRRMTSRSWRRQAPAGSSEILASARIGWRAMARSAKRSRSSPASMKRCASVAARTKLMRSQSHTATTIAIGASAVARPRARASWLDVSPIEAPASSSVVPEPAACVSQVRSWSPTNGICCACSPAPVRRLVDRRARRGEGVGGGAQGRDEVVDPPAGIHPEADPEQDEDVGEHLPRAAGRGVGIELHGASRVGSSGPNLGPPNGWCRSGPEHHERRR